MLSGDLLASVSWNTLFWPYLSSGSWSLMVSKDPDQKVRQFRSATSESCRKVLSTVTHSVLEHYMASQHSGRVAFEYFRELGSYLGHARHDTECRVQRLAETRINKGKLTSFIL